MKLLEFKPDTQEKPQGLSALDMVSDDMKYGLTPDMPVLRFSGPQRVFVWDECRDLAMWHSMKLSTTEDIMTDVYQAYTKFKFLPFSNESGSKHEYKHFLPIEKEWYKKVDGAGPTHLATYPPRSVYGKIILTSLKTIVTLDQYFGNGIIFHRVKMPIVHAVSGKEEYCWVYVNKINSLTKFDPHKNKSVLGETIKPTPFIPTMVSGVQVFESKRGI